MDTIDNPENGLSDYAYHSILDMSITDLVPVDMNFVNEREAIGDNDDFPEIRVTSGEGSHNLLHEMVEEVNSVRNNDVHSVEEFQEEMVGAESTETACDGNVEGRRKVKLGKEGWKKCTKKDFAKKEKSTSEEHWVRPKL
ncbi:hypothetical protein RRG08_027362 [Elysia crispata]|uniref:Uncharacterized protein n=1 Tax=Elysia crispata TaxID=231223 RepID=A0AAE0YM72_9GAST|nr:hypothetical protein RRG08_027362 [Elysia crispata]